MYPSTRAHFHIKQFDKSRNTNDDVLLQCELISTYFQQAMHIQRIRIATYNRQMRDQNIGFNGISQR